MVSAIVVLIISLIVVSFISIVLFYLLYQDANVEVEPKKGIEILALVSTKVTNTYSYAIKVCSGKSQLDYPFVAVSSDTEEKSYRLAQNIIPNNTCQISGGIIQALAPESIQFSLTSASPIFPPKELESRANDLKAQLTAKNNELSKLLSTIPEPPDFDKRLIEIVKKISELRTELKDLRAQYDNYTLK